MLQFYVFGRKKSGGGKAANYRGILRFWGVLLW
jgi:hypothetical protein